MATGNFERKLSAVAGAPVTNVRPIAENKYCTILLAMMGTERAVFKIYRAGDASLPRLEAEGVDFWHRVVQGDDIFLDGRTVALSEAEGIVGVSFIPGERLADYLHARASRRDEWERCAGAMLLLGQLLRKMREASLQPEAELDPFHAEYLRYTSRRLREMPVLGRQLFARAPEEAEALLADWAAVRPAVSFAHGDFVFRNIHIDGYRIGLIDFANAQKRSHPANDALNLWFGLQNMLLPEAFRSRLWIAFQDGYGAADFPEEAERFFFEYHRRRWLMLNLRTRDPRRWVRALRGLGSFARPGRRGFLR